MISGSCGSEHLCAGLGYGQVADRLREPVRGGLWGAPTVCVTGDRVLGQAEAQRVLDMVGRCVLR